MTSHVWLLSVHHKHGDDTTVYTSEQAAHAGLLDYVAQCWTEIAGDEYTTSSGEPRRVPQDMPADAATAIDIYFEAHADEWFGIEQKSVNE